MKTWRLILAVAGCLLLAFGVFRLVTEIGIRNLVFLAVWLIAALIIHDGVLSPAVVSVGWLLRRLVPDRGRRYLQIALIMSGLVAVVAIPMIYLRGSQPEVKALLLGNYGANLTLLVGVIAVVVLALYAVRVAQDRSPSSAHRAEGPAPED